MDETLATALRRWRDRLSPLDVGLPDRGARRATGLRREELADLAGLSVDYVVRLEQARATSPSAQVVGSLARALQLDRTERDHLFRLAGLLPPADGLVSTHVPPGIARMVARLGELPQAVFTADWTLLSWTPMWAALLGDPLRLVGSGRNLVRAVFAADDAGGDGLAAWPVRHETAAEVEEFRRALVSDLRTASVTHPRDPGLSRLVGDLRASSTEFARLWETGALGVHESTRKTVAHPVLGEVEIDCDVLTAPGSGVRLVVYSAATSSPAAAALEFLRVTSGLHDGPTSTPAAAPPATS